MDTAYCTLDGVTYHITTFAALPQNEIAEKRRHLICPDPRCRMQAYFKRAATSGQGACFGARPHSKNCDLAASLGESRLGSTEVRDILRNPMDHIVIDTTCRGRGSFHIEGEDDSPGAPKGGQFQGDGPRGPSKMNRRLRPLLKSLIASEQFRNSSTIIELPQHFSLPVNKLFVNFNDIGPNHEKSFHGFWGLIYDTGTSYSGAFWLNTGERDELSVMVPAELYSDFKKRFGFQFDHEAEGMHVLVLGSLRSAQSGKKYIALRDINMCALCND
ncbi:hypothetical protein CZ787_00125 [Halomonas citrativorans]|uniref:Uncharacterized protein n=1 Tax=Halomonas citrativorans TaxID=2742612 RepID=A0A1R4HMR9_9GAMM|nr:hypothetical protein [Halomonas citrativorans]SJN08832.1 hypothetical protein CZ787_00125 [Halomonas citrativorans]